MNVSFKELISRKIIIQALFIIFIFLNIADFFNYLPEDLDFLKKILSWLIIGYIFYKVSFTKILIGKRLKYYDLLFIISFSLMGIMKALTLYAKINADNMDNFILFGWILQLKVSGTLIYDSNLFLPLTFLTGLIISLILTVNLLLNHKVSKDSFLGSLEIKEGFFKYIIEQISAIIMVLFFGLILFNLFMEWFALAVDSVILVLGLVYYLYVYIKLHTKHSVGEFIQDVVNTGNEFYQNLIKMFSKKSTILLAISFILTLHSIVDAGVYLVPYSIGTENQLYFDKLGIDEHKPLFNFFEFGNSRFSFDLENTNGDALLMGTVFLSYIFSLFFFYSFMILPFYIFYNNVSNKKVVFNKFFAIVLISSMAFYLTLVALPQAHPPLEMKKPSAGLGIQGVDIITTNLTDGINGYELVTCTFLFFILLIFLFFRYDKYKLFFDKTILVVLLVFFLLYISSFFNSIIEVEYDNLRSDFLEFEDHKKFNEERFSEYLKIFIDESKIKDRSPFGTNYIGAMYFSDLDVDESKGKSFVLENRTHKDFIYYKLRSDSDEFYIKLSEQIKNQNYIFFSENDKYEIKSGRYVKILDSEIEIIEYLGHNQYEIVDVGGNLKLDMNLDKEETLKRIRFEKPSAFDNLRKFIEYLRLSFTSVFYMLAMISFTLFFIRRNILDED